MPVNLLKTIATARSERNASGDRIVVEVYEHEPAGRGLLIRAVSIETRLGAIEPLLSAGDFLPLWHPGRPSDWPEFTWNRPSGSVPVSLERTVFRSIQVCK